MINKYLQFINEEVGIRNLKSVIEGYKNCEIWFHKDLDGVCSAISMNHFLKTYYGLKLIDSHNIQYGSMEFAVKSGKSDSLKVLVDFAHSKPMFKIASDHHDKQVGSEDTDATYFKSARSNVEIISGEISYSDAFTPQDIELIKTVDSANFLKHNLLPEDIQNSIFEVRKEMSGEKNRFMMGFIVNRLLLAYKNKRITVNSLDGKRVHTKKNFLECLVMDSTPSLYSIFNNIRHYINNAKSLDRIGTLAKPEDLQKNLFDYIERMKNYKFVEINGEPVEYDPTNPDHKYMITSGSKISKGSHFDEKYKIITQYGGGTMYKPGSYDRYVPFKNYPESNFICIVWPMGLIQVSCNPFKEKKLKDINLGEISKEVMSSYQSDLEKLYVSLESVKNELENSQDWKKMKKEEGPGYEGVGFRFSDLKAFYGDCLFDENKSEIDIDNLSSDIKSIMDIPHEKMNWNMKTKLKSYFIPVWDLIVRNSGGHPSITNIQGFNFLKYDKSAIEGIFGTQKYTDVMKKVARDFVNNLKDKIDKSESGELISYKNTDLELKGQDTNEDYKYYLSDKSGDPKPVSKEEFDKAGSPSGMKPEKKSGLTIDSNSKRIIAKFEDFKTSSSE